MALVVFLQEDEDVYRNLKIFCETAHLNDEPNKNDKEHVDFIHSLNLSMWK